MKKLLLSLLVIGLTLFSSPVFSQEDPFKKFGIPDKFRNYRVKGKSMLDKLVFDMGDKKFYLFKRWDIDRDGVVDVGEFYELEKKEGVLSPVENPSWYFFNLEENLEIKCHEMFNDRFLDGWFNGNEERLCPPSVFYEKKLPPGYSELG